ncbi:MAG: FecR domain-containing protein, partial [Bacteroidota bacterium]
LEGEAYFSVVKDVDTHRKFLVHTEGLAVEVLGTTFNVNQRAQTTEVVLTSGRVKLSLDNPEQEKVLMQPGELVAYSSQTQRYVKQPIDTKIYTSWKDNLLIFKNQPLREIARTIEDRYGYTIRFDDPKIGEERFTTTLPADQVDILFTMLASSYDIHQDQSTITLYEKGKGP